MAMQKFTKAERFDVVPEDKKEAAQKVAAAAKAKECDGKCEVCTCGK